MKRETEGTIITMFGCLLIALVLWIVSSKFEAEAFYRLTGKKVSTWDAMFLDLRVQEPMK